MAALSDDETADLVEAFTEDIDDALQGEAASPQERLVSLRKVRTAFNTAIDARLEVTQEALSQ